MRLLGMEKDQYTSIFLAISLSMLSLITSLNTMFDMMFGEYCVYDAILLNGIFFFFLAATLISNGFKMSKSIIILLIFFVGAAAITLIINPDTSVYIQALDRKFLSQPIPKFFIYCFSTYIAAIYLDNTEYFLKIFEKMSYIVITLALVYYFLTLDGVDDLVYMSFSYDMLLHTIFLAILAINKFNVFRLVFSITGIVVIFLAGCRGALVVGLGAILVYIIMSPFQSRGKKTFLCIFLGGLALYIYFNFEIIINNLNVMLAEMDISSRTLFLISEGEFLDDSSRFIIQEKIIKDFNLWGHGIFSDRLIAEGSYAHNIFLEFLYEFGIIFGTVLSIAFIVIVIKGFMKATGPNRVIVCALLSTGFFKFFFSGSYLNQEPGFYALLGICLNFISNRRMQNEKNIEINIPKIKI